MNNIPIINANNMFNMVFITAFISVNVEHREPIIPIKINKSQTGKAFEYNLSLNHNIEIVNNAANPTVIKMPINTFFNIIEPIIPNIMKNDSVIIKIIGNNLVFFIKMSYL